MTFLVWHFGNRQRKYCHVLYTTGSYAEALRRAGVYTDSVGLTSIQTSEALGTGGPSKDRSASQAATTDNASQIRSSGSSSSNNSNSATTSSTSLSQKKLIITVCAVVGSLFVVAVVVAAMIVRQRQYHPNRVDQDTDGYVTNPVATVTATRSPYPPQYQQYQYPQSWYRAGSTHHQMSGISPPSPQVAFRPGAYMYNVSLPSPGASFQAQQQQYY